MVVPITTGQGINKDNYSADTYLASRSGGMPLYNKKTMKSKIDNESTIFQRNCRSYRFHEFLKKTNIIVSKKTIPVFILIIVSTVTAFSCRKGQFASEHYQGGVVVSSSQLSTTALEVRFDGATTGDSLTAGGSVQKTFDFNGNTIKDGIRTNFKVYKAGTDQLIADTNVLLHKGQLPVFHVIYNDDLGMGGFINGTDVPQDSIRMRIIFHDHTAAKKFATLEWQFYQSKGDYPYYDEDNNVKLIFSLHENQYSADFYIPVFQKDNVSYTYLFARIKDPVTGNFLYWFPDVGVFDTAIQTFGEITGGTYWFTNFNLVDNDGSEDGSGVDYYAIEYSFLKL